MNNLIVVLTLFFNLGLGNCQTKDTIYGEVKSVREQVKFMDSSRQNYKLFSIDGDYGHSGFMNPEATKYRFNRMWTRTGATHYINYYKEFDKSRLPLKELWFYKNGDTLTELSYHYDKRGNLIQLRDCFTTDDCDITNYSYDDENNLMSEINFQTNDPTEYVYTAYKRDSLSNMVESIHFYNNGNWTGWKYGYDTSNRKVSKSLVFIKNMIDDNYIIKHNDSIDVTSLCEEYIYDNRDDLIEKIYYKCEESDLTKHRINYKTIYEYEDTRLPIRSKTIMFFGKKSSSSITEYYYDSNDNLLEEIHYYNDDRKSLKYDYDDNSNVKTLIINDSGKQASVNYEYEFDQNGNWIKQIKSVDDVQLYVWTRQIRYFK